MKSRIAAGLALMFASFPCFGAGGYIIQQAMDQAGRAERQAAATDMQCRERLKTIGEFKETGPQGFEVTVRNVTDARKALADVTAAQALCPQRTVTAVCLGEACDRSANGVTLRFRMLNRPS